MVEVGTPSSPLSYYTLNATLFSLAIAVGTRRLLCVLPVLTVKVRALFYEFHKIAVTPTCWIPLSATLHAR